MGAAARASASLSAPSSSARPTNTGLTDLVSTVVSMAQTWGFRAARFPVGETGVASGGVRAVRTSGPSRGACEAVPDGCRYHPPLGFVAALPLGLAGLAGLTDEAAPLGRLRELSGPQLVQFVLEHVVLLASQWCSSSLFAMPPLSSARGVRHIGRVPHLAGGGGLRAGVGP
ncbi:hypothetical protein STRAU_3908 [Streptomyces aurantiacus JA 4570]|uniref:Uncharacterized protein n=1 Tax=Streptomyces aurantiacus JA 4570 TaxID=1286094 RepID=S3ZJU3_9ACTN|nr:hypothetical protein STRAU_3908 [Streptomyces aurantiacus JA 4570]